VITTTKEPYDPLLYQLTHDLGYGSASSEALLNLACANGCLLTLRARVEKQVGIIKYKTPGEAVQKSLFWYELQKLAE
jgi:hypothetical protein